MKEVKIGVIYPLTGGAAAAGRELRAGAELAAEIANTVMADLPMTMAKNDGIKSLGGAKIKLIFKDHEGNPTVGADLANIINEAALLAARNDKETVEPIDFDEAIDRVVAGLQKKNRVMNPKEKEIVAFHESGHAIVAESVDHADPVHKISIIPRGIAALGYTMQVPTEDRFLMTKTELQNKVATLLGGRASEELVFGDVSTGAHNDLSKATDIARSMVKEYGMSSKVGKVYFAREKRSPFLDMGMEGSGEYSDSTAELIDY